MMQPMVLGEEFCRRLRVEVRCNKVRVPHRLRCRLEVELRDGNTLVGSPNRAMIDLIGHEEYHTINILSLRGIVEPHAYVVMELLLFVFFDEAVRRFAINKKICKLESQRKRFGMCKQSKAKQGG